MAVLQDAANYATDPRLNGPLTAAIDQAAIAILAEDPAAANHDQRVALARVVVQSPGSFVERFAWATSTNGQLTADWAAGDIEAALSELQFVVDSVWDHIAGV